MADWRELTEKEKQEIVKEYNKKYNLATAMNLSVVLTTVVIILLMEFIKFSYNARVGMATVLFIMFIATLGYKHTLMNCPVCGRTYGNRKHKPTQCSNCNTYLGSIFDREESQ